MAGTKVTEKRNIIFPDCQYRALRNFGTQYVIISNVRNSIGLHLLRSKEKLVNDGWVPVSCRSRAHVAVSLQFQICKVRCLTMSEIVLARFICLRENPVNNGWVPVSCRSRAHVDTRVDKLHATGITERR